MSILATGASAIGFVESLIGIGAADNQRIIVYELVDDKGAPIKGEDDQPQTQQLPPFVTISEHRHDEVQITDHPVEVGSVVSDHAYRMPASLQMRIGWTPSSAAGSGNPSIFGLAIPTLSGFLGQSGGAGNTYIQEIYTLLLGIMGARQLVQIATPKRTYQRMLLHSVTEETTTETENTLVVVCAFREIMQASIQTGQLVVNPAAQAAPEQTTPTAPQGDKQVTEPLPVPPPPPVTPAPVEPVYPAAPPFDEVAPVTTTSPVTADPNLYYLTQPNL
jgi:hypothetical protein